MTTIPTVTLSDDHPMPQLGFGVWRVEDSAAEPAVLEALKVGYRSIDTAAMYQNEEGVGRALAATDVPRSEIFLTTKLDNDSHGRDATLRAVDESLRKLGTDYIDLYLIHWPQPTLNKFVETWQAMVEVRDAGRIRSIGVCNFTEEYLQRIIDASGVAPVLNQIELHPYLQQQHMREANQSRGIFTEAWSPLGQGGDVLADPVITSIAEKRGATAAQVILAWHLAIGNIVIPKSVTPSRIAENFAAADVTLSDADLSDIAALDRGGRLGPDPTTVG